MQPVLPPSSSPVNPPILTVPHSFLVDTKGKLKLQFTNLLGINKTYLTVKPEIELRAIPDYVRDFFIVYSPEFNQSIGICRGCLQNRVGLWSEDLEFTQDSPTLESRLQTFVKEMQTQYFALYPIFDQVFEEDQEKELIKVVARVAQKKLIWRISKTNEHSVTLIPREETKIFPWIKCGNQSLFVHFPIEIASGGFKVIYETLECEKGLRAARVVRKKEPSENIKEEDAQRIWETELETLREIKAAQDQGIDTEGIVHVYEVISGLINKDEPGEIGYLKYCPKDAYDYMFELDNKPEEKLQLAYYIIKGIINFQLITGRIHRDLTLANFLVDHDHNYKEANPKLPVACLCDFGSAHKKETPILIDSFGTVGHISPELIQKEKVTEADLETNEAWALGTILWMMFFGINTYWGPFQSEYKWEDSLASMKSWEIQVQPKRASLTGVKAIIYRLLTFNAKERMTIPAAFQALIHVIESKDPSLGFPTLTRDLKGAVALVLTIDDDEDPGKRQNRSPFRK